MRVMYLTGYQTFSGRYRALLEEGFSDVAVEVGQARQKNTKDQSESRGSYELSATQRILAHIFAR